MQADADSPDATNAGTLAVALLTALVDGDDDTTHNLMFAVSHAQLRWTCVWLGAMMLQVIQNDITDDKDQVEAWLRDAGLKLARLHSPES